MRYLPFFLFALLVGAYALADGYSSYKDAPPGGSVDGTAISPSSVTTGALTATGTSGEAHSCAWHEQTLTFAANPGDASKTATGLIPAGSVLYAVTTRALVAGTNCASINIGDGVDPNLWGNAIAVAAGTTTNNASATANWTNPQLTAGDVVLTGNVNCFDLSVRVAVYYCTTTAPTL